VPLKHVAHELIWFLRGDTNTDYLRANGIKIWDGNTSREYLDSTGLTYFHEGQIGAGYGHQWRNFDGKYDPYTDTSIQDGVDQIEDVIYSLKNNPWSRRHVVSAWNPKQSYLTALVPCHFAFEFFVEPNTNGEPAWLSCCVQQRSADVFLGSPFNICSYGLLTHIIAQICGLNAKELVINMTDAHLYETHLEQIREQISRTPRRFPAFKFSDRVLKKENLNIDDFTSIFDVSDFIVNEYHPHPGIKAPMVV
jgi:thymidylate synthase